MELIDLVDENDQVIGEITKDEAHEVNAIHRIVTVFVFDKEGRLLIQRRKKDGYLDASVGGHVEQGESYEAAAGRELEEELGVRLDYEYISGPSLEVWKSIPRRHQMTLYAAKLEDASITPALNEVVEIIPMALVEVLEQIKQNPTDFAEGLMYSLNSYIRKYSLDLPLIEL